VNRIRPLLSALACVLAAALAPAAQTVYRSGPTVLDDQVPGAEYSSPAGMVEFEGALYFSATSSGTGKELHRYTEAGGVELVAEIVSGTNSSSPQDLVVFDGALYFTAHTGYFGSGATGQELYRYTAAGGIELAADVNPGPPTSAPAWLTVYDGALYFQATTSTTGKELYRYTRAGGAVLAADIAPGSAASAPNNFAVYDGALYFHAQTQANGQELYRYTAASGAQLIDLVPGTGTSDPRPLTVYDGALYFGATLDAAIGRELYRYTAAGGAELAAEFAPGNDGAILEGFTTYDGALFISGGPTSTGRELYRYTPADGLSLIADLLGPQSGGGSNPGAQPRDFTVFRGALYFSANGEDADGTHVARELFRYAPADGAQLVVDFRPGDATTDPIDLIVFEDGLIYGGIAPNVGNELLRYRPEVVVGDAASPAGYYFLAAPGVSETVGGVLGPVWTQGFPGADAPAGALSVFLHDETAPGGADDGYTAPASAAARLAPGTGVIAYLYADDDPTDDAPDDGFPKVLPVASLPPSLPFAFPVTFTDAGPAGPDNDADGQPDDGWNLLGNPLPGPLDWPATYRAASTAAVSDVVYLYDPARGFLTIDGDDGSGTLGSSEVPGGSAFWALATGPDPSLVAPDAAPPRRAAQPAPSVVLRAASTDAAGRALSGSALVKLVPGAALGLDGDDAPALSLAGGAHVTLHAEAEGGARLLHAALPAALTGPVDIPLALGTAGVVTTGTLTAEGALPDGWAAALVDLRTGVAEPLTDGAPVALDLAGLSPAPSTGRYALRLTPGASVASADRPTEPLVSLLRPNPASGRTELIVVPSGPERVRAAVYDALGREVAVLHDGPMAGRARLVAEVGTLAPGVYVVRVAGESFTASRPLTVVR
jgi:ELWxxDGT repeat protein